MKWAQAHEVGTPFFELYIATDDLHHVSAGEQFLNKRLWDGHDAIVETGSALSPLSWQAGTGRLAGRLPVRKI